MVDLVVEPGVMRLIQAIKFSVFDYWANAMGSEHRSEFGPPRISVRQPSYTAFQHELIVDFLNLQSRTYEYPVYNPMAANGLFSTLRY